MIYINFGILIIITLIILRIENSVDRFIIFMVGIFLMFINSIFFKVIGAIF